MKANANSSIWHEHLLGMLAGAILTGAALPALAADGVLEINQTCAEGPGCFPGDSAGFPVQLANPGSYHLTGNLTVDDEATNAIRIMAAHITIDLGGFTISGPAVCSGEPVTSCTNAGTGDGILAANNPDNFHDITIRNGDIRGMGDDAISLQNIGGVHVDGVRAVGNAGFGFKLGPRAQITNSLAASNLENGISASTASRVHGSTSMHNGGIGMNLAGGITIVTDSLSINNGNIGLNCGAAETDTCTIDGVTSSQNENFGMTLGNHAILRGSNITANANGQVIFNGEGGYVGNVISGGTPVSGTGAVELGLNLCNGDTSCP